MISARAAVLAVLTLLIGGPGKAQPTGNVLSRVFQIRYGSYTATTFLIDYEDRQYFVTARHLFVDATPSKVNVNILGPGIKGWKTYPVDVLLGKDACVDVAVLIPEEKKISNAENLPYPYNYAIGQEAYFLGFPYGLYTSFGDQSAFALVKHAYISASVPCSAIRPDGDQDDGLLLLDGLNNPGFSGGPVVAPDMFVSFTNIRPQKLIGVVSGFRNEQGKINLNGQEVPNASVTLNSGIMVVTPIQRVVELLKEYSARQKH